MVDSGVWKSHDFTWKDKGKYHGFWEIVCDQVQKSWFDYDKYTSIYCII